MNDKDPWQEFLNARYQAILWLEKRGFNNEKIAITLSVDEAQIYSIKRSMENFNLSQKKDDTYLCQNNDYLNLSQRDQFKNEFLCLMKLRDESNSIEKEYLESRNKFFDKWGK